MEATFTRTGAVEWLQGYGTWAWAPATLLLMGDLVLPIPATAVMAALGFIYGPVTGGLISAGGSFLLGAVAYGLCRLVGRRAALWIVGEKDLARGEELFRQMGGWLVALSRWLPLFPEVIACMAGLARMPAKLFLLAMACGCLPLGFTFAAVGSAGVEHPMLAIGLSALLPPILWLIIQHYLRKRSRSGAMAQTGSRMEP
jgi:uncharacterized membrane protein YdjX (TVP38/TMEM64 family)